MSFSLGRYLVLGSDELVLTSGFAFRYTLFVFILGLRVKQKWALGHAFKIYIYIYLFIYLLIMAVIRSSREKSKNMQSILRLWLRTANATLSFLFTNRDIFKHKVSGVGKGPAYRKLREGQGKVSGSMKK